MAIPERLKNVRKSVISAELLLEYRDVIFMRGFSAGSVATQGINSASDDKDNVRDGDRERERESRRAHP